MSEIPGPTPEELEAMREHRRLNMAEELRDNPANFYEKYNDLFIRTMLRFIARTDSRLDYIEAYLTARFPGTFNPPAP